MKKIAIIAAGAALLLSAMPALAGAKNATYLEWYWDNPQTPGNGDKSAYFMSTGSGIVHGWTYDHPDFGDARFIYKPLEKFKNAAKEGCDDGYLMKNLNWWSKNLWQVMDNQGYKDAFDLIFGGHDAYYLLCIYPME